MHSLWAISGIYLLFVLIGVILAIVFYIAVTKLYKINQTLKIQEDLLDSVDTNLYEIKLIQLEQLETLKKIINQDNSNIQ